MNISLIVAVDRQGLIGNEAGLPWRLPRDLKRFRALTLGKPVLMGRTTFGHIGRPLPDRHNIVLSRDPSFTATGCETASSLEEGLAVAQKVLARTGGDEVMIIGGGQVYREALRLWDKLYLTVIDEVFSGTAYFPVADLCRLGGRLVHEEAWPVDEKNPHAHSFFIIERERSADSPAPPTDPLQRGPDGAIPVARALEHFRVKT